MSRPNDEVPVEVTQRNPYEDTSGPVLQDTLEDDES